jgi:hypothetical protein
MPSLGYALTALAVVLAVGSAILPERMIGEIERSLLTAPATRQAATAVNPGDRH